MFFFAPLAWRTTPLLMHLIFLPFLLFCLCLSRLFGGAFTFPLCYSPSKFFVVQTPHILSYFSIARTMSAPLAYIISAKSRIMPMV